MSIWTGWYLSNNRCQNRLEIARSVIPQWKKYSILQLNIEYFFHWGIALLAISKRFCLQFTTLDQKRSKRTFFYKLNIIKPNLFKHVNYWKTPLLVPNWPFLKCINMIRIYIYISNYNKKNLSHYNHFTKIIYIKIELILH